MPIYYFNLDGAPSASMTFNNITHAKDEALCYLAHAMIESPRAFWQELMLGMTITDEVGRILFTLRLAGSTSSGAS